MSQGKGVWWNESNHLNDFHVYINVCQVTIYIGQSGDTMQIDKALPSHYNDYETSQAAHIVTYFTVRRWAGDGA